MYCSTVRIAVNEYLESGFTNHAQRPEHNVVNQQPSLLAESGHELPVGDALELRNRCEDVFHRRGPEAGEKDNTAGDKVRIVETNAILARIGVVVAQLIELGGMDSSFRDECLGEEEKRKQVERQA